VALLPKAAESLTAISGLIPARPLTTAETLALVMPRPFEPEQVAILPDTTLQWQYLSSVWIKKIMRPPGSREIVAVGRNCLCKFRKNAYYHKDFPVKVLSIPNEGSTTLSSIEFPFLKTIENR
jgi:hypothetical protein